MDFGRNPVEIENKRKRLLILFFAVAGGFFLFVFGCVSFFVGRHVIGAAVFSLFVVAVVVGFVVRVVDEYQPLSMVVAALLLIFSVWLVLGGGAGGTGVYWSYPLCILMVLMPGPRVALIYVVSYLLIIYVGFYGGILDVYEYGDLEEVRILASTSALAVIVLISEWARFKSYGAISSTSESYREFANKDSLTKALNRAGLESAINDAVEKRGGVVVMIDIDNFKQINDVYGHDAGDNVLVHLVDHLKRNIRGSDLVVRFGGEEFLLVLFGVTKAAAYDVVDKMRAGFGEKVFNFKGEEVRCTFSAGISCLRFPSEIDASISQADENLYAAKDAGRNQVMI